MTTVKLLYMSNVATRVSPWLARTEEATGPEDWAQRGSGVNIL